MINDILLFKETRIFLFNFDMLKKAYDLYNKNIFKQSSCTS